MRRSNRQSRTIASKKNWKIQFLSIKVTALEYDQITLSEKIQDFNSTPYS